MHPGLALIESKHNFPLFSEIGLNIKTPIELDIPVRNENLNFFSQKKLSLQSNADDLTKPYSNNKISKLVKTYNLTQENKQRVRMLIKMFGNQSFDLKSEYV